MMMPAALRSAVAAAVEGAGSRREGAGALSAAYRMGKGSAGLDLSAYLVTRLPATYAAVSRVLAEAALCRPGFSPRSLLDVGSGPGTASWAAAEHWPGLEDIVFYDNDAAFLELAQRLARSGSPALARATGHRGGIEALPADLSADLVIAAYVLAELPLSAMPIAAKVLWRAAGGMLVVVEPGTPEGFSRVRAVRDFLLSEGAVAVAPCTHGGECPLPSGDWCHFAARLPRSRAHMHAKGASVPFEDEKFCYLVLARSGAVSGGGRILSPPRHMKHASILRLCAQDGIAGHSVARRGGAAYKQARKLEWGDRFAPGEEEGT